MKKRIASAVLWFYAGWTFGAALATMLGVNGTLGLIIGVASVVLFAADPCRVIWTKGPQPEGFGS